jgi:23S rRNA (uridine2552-2'-O)-methyltransferase
MAYKPHDAYYKKAKQEGYRSRAAYKLLELQQRFRLMKPGDLVVDLGAAPGGWLQVAAKTVGRTGKVVGVDLQPMEPFHETNVTSVQGDIMSAAVQQEIKKLLDDPAHCVLSDLAPRLSGIRDADTARCLELNRIALSVATELLRPGGILLIKVLSMPSSKRLPSQSSNTFAPSTARDQKPRGKLHRNFTFVPKIIIPGPVASPDYSW